MNLKGKNLVELLTQFLIDNVPERRTDDFNELVGYVWFHYKSGTLDFEIDDKGITYVMRYNLPSDGMVKVLDLAVRKDLRGKSKLMKYVAVKNWIRYPLTQAIWYDREFKRNKIPRIYKLEKFLGGHDGDNKD